MTYLKAAIVTTLFVICALIIFMFMTVDVDYQVNLAVDAFLKGDYNKAETYLSKIKETIPQNQWYLYKGYIDRAKKELEKSTQDLSQAAQIKKEHQPAALTLEIYLNQALNGYLQDQPELLSSALKQALNTDPSNPWTVFFSGLNAFKQGNCKEALETWENMGERQALSSWMKKAFNEVFSPLWLKLHASRCQIEEGKYLAARQDLIEESRQASNEALPEINFLIGLTYAKEAEEKPPSASLPYYKLAFSYFNRVPILEKQYAQQRQKIISQILAKTKSLIETQSFNDIAFYLSILENWNARPEMKEVASLLIKLLNSEIDAKQLQHVQELTNILNRILPQGEIRNSLGKRFEELLSASITEGNVEAMALYWDASQLFSSNPQQLKEKVADDIASGILSKIPNDDSELKTTALYLVFWNQLQPSEKKRTAFTSKLITIDESLWEKKGEEQKASKLMLMITPLPPANQQKAFLSSIETLLTRLYQAAMQKEDIDKLSFIYQTAEKLHLETLVALQKQNLSDYLEKTQTFFSNKQFAKAKKWGEWVLQIDPQNQQALKIVGLVDYQNADYLQAITYLSRIKERDPELAEPIAISLILTGKPAEGEALLKKLEANRPLKRETLLRLGLGFLIANNPTAALDWLKKINDPDSEVYAALSFASYLTKNWSATLHYFHQAMTPYQNLDGLQGIAVQAAEELNNLGLAEDILNRLLQNDKQPSSDAFPLPFAVFKEKVLDPINRFYIAGSFYKTMKHDNRLAVDYFLKIPDPNPDILLQRGETFLSLQLLPEAKKDLLAAVTQTEFPEMSRKAIPLLAEAYYLQGEYFNAYPWLQKYLQLGKPEAKYLSIYSSVLRHLRRFDLSMEQLLLLKKNGELSTKDKMGYIESLIHTDHFDDAIAMAKQMIDQKPAIPIMDQLAIGKLLLTTRQSQMIWPLVEDLLNSKVQITEKEAIALIQLLLEVAAYPEASTLINSLSPSFEKSVDGLLVLATLNEALSNRHSALAFAKQAAALNPSSPEPIDFLIQHETDLDFLQNLLHNLQKETGQQPLNHPTSSVEFIALVCRLAELQPENDQSTIRLHQANDLNSKLIKQYPEIPILYFFQGRLAELSKNVAKATAGYQQALKLDPSYSQAAKRLALIANQQNNLPLALDNIQQALKFDPNDSEAWTILAQLSIRAEKWEQAISSLYQALKFRPRDIQNFLILGDVYLELKNPENAKVIAEAALKLDPTSKPALSLLLRCLYDASLSVGKNIKELETLRKEAYQRLHDIDAPYAEKLLLQLKGNEP